MFWFLRKPSGKQTKTIGTTTAACDALDIQGFAGGVVTVTSGITILTFYGAHTEDETFLPLKDKDNNPVTLTVSSTQMTQLPPEIYDVPFAKTVANASGIAYFSLKS